MKTLLLALVYCLLLASCGFRPLHESSRQDVFSSIRLGRIEGEQEYLLKRYLENTLHLNNSGTKSVELDVSAKKSITSSIIKHDDAVSGQDVRVTANYVLRDLETNSVIKSGVVKVVVNASLVDSPFASESNLDKAYSDALKEVSSILKTHVAMVLSRK